ncbi:MAG: FliH/SctL family protein [Planctomycetota bacterium]|nr:FliH/SctL family protein [Planctomycetota bacterium]
MVGLRLLPRHPKPESEAAEKVRWLVQLGEERKRREVEKQFVTQAAQSIQQGVAGLTATVNERLDQVAGLAVELGLQLARELVGDALDKGLVDPTPTVVRCLRDAVQGSTDDGLTVYLHPDDLGVVLARLGDVPGLTSLVASTDFQADSSLQRGAVRAETGSGRLRYDPDEVFARMADAVRSAAAEAGR